jgi:putative ABC transport system ATP-binding protein
VIELRGVCRTFRLGDSEVRALRDLSFAIGAGEYLSVMGPSGSGKSTLLNVLGLLDRPDAGEYLLDGVATARLPEERRARLRRERIGFVFQSYHLVGRLTARENIELPLVLAGQAPRERARIVDGVLERLGLADRAAHLPNQLSGGQRQRVAIGRSIVMKPGLLLADEPTGNLDSRSGAEVTALLEELNGGGITLLVVTHDPAIGARARRRLRMLDGELVQDERDAERGRAHG